VGGATKFYGAALYRLREQDFGELKHHGGISPAWPVGYDVFEPYYTQAEELYQVHGIRGEDPTDPPASAPHPFRSPCIRCATCDGFPCLVHAKADADVIAVRPSLSYPNVTLVRNATVRRLETDASGRSVTSVVADVEGEEQRFSALLVVVSAGAANSAKLLLASANDRHPHGLANGSDQVGRNRSRSRPRWRPPWLSTRSPSARSTSGCPSRTCRIRTTASPWPRTATSS
jgi:choline dehydrogenase-like flavoprotein